MQNEAWLDEINRIVSFHEISDSRYYSAEEHDFWQMIVSLILAGYRAVSYTHLDVYKRQREGCAEDLGEGRADVAGVAEDDDEGEDDIEDAHDRDELFGHRADALDAAEEEHADQARDCLLYTSSVSARRSRWCC